MATLKTEFLIDLLLRLGFSDAELLADIKSKLSAKYQREIEQGELEDAVSYISDVNTIQSRMCDDTTSNIDLSISSTDSTDSLLHFTTSAIYNKERKEVDLSESQGLANDDTTRDLVSRIQDLDLTCLREAVEHQKMRVETEEHEESAEDEDAEWTRSNPYDPQLYEAAESQGDSGSEEEQHHYVSPPTNRGFIHHKPRPTQLKKHDPVSSFHKHNDRWKKDPFLSRVDRARTAPSGGHGFVLNRGSSAGGARGVSAVRPRHDLAGMRSGYVVPTTKKRDALVWDVRKGIATSI